MQLFKKENKCSKYKYLYLFMIMNDLLKLMLVKMFSTSTNLCWFKSNKFFVGYDVFIIQWSLYYRRHVEKVHALHTYKLQNIFTNIYTRKLLQVCQCISHISKLFALPAMGNDENNNREIYLIRVSLVLFILITCII